MAVNANEDIITSQCVQNAFIYILHYRHFYMFAEKERVVRFFLLLLSCQNVELLLPPPTDTINCAKKAFSF